MIQPQLKLKLNKKQETQLWEWLFCLTGVWNWAIRKIELDAKDGIYYRKQTFQNLLAGHGQLRLMLAYKSLNGGRKYIETNFKNSTRVCSCCGATHDRDVHAAINTLMIGVGATHEVRLAA